MPIVSNFPSGYGNMNTEIYDAQNRKQDIFDYADTVQENLGEHVSNQGNPHNVTAEQVGADPAGSAAAVQGNLDTHTSNHNNPHGVTAAQVGLGNVNNTSDADKPISTATQQALNTKADKVTPSAANNVALLSADGNLLDSGKLLIPSAIGAAPAGYGLGMGSSGLADVPTNDSGKKDLNLAINNGWYYIYNSENYDNFPGTDQGGPSGGYHVMRVDRYRTITQTIYFGYQDWAGCVATRYWYNGTETWSDWEWINPRMRAGVEYQTTERMDGETVYVKYINFGQLPKAGSKSVSHGISEEFSLVFLEGVAVETRGWQSRPIPFVIDDGPALDIYIDDTTITVEAISNVSQYSAKFTVKYTKVTGGTVTP